MISNKQHMSDFSKTLLIMLFLFIMAMVLIGINRKNNKDVCISEVCPHNSSIVHNFAGFYYDYIEIHNLTNEEFDLSGYYLSDDEDDLEKYSLDYYILEPNGYVLIFCDPLVTNFKVSDEETVYLTSPEGKLVDRIKLPKTNEDEVYGLNQDTGEWSLCIPSPREDNIFDDMKSDYIEAPTTNIKGGFYDEPQYIELSSEFDIYYTLDGSTPTINSTKYTEPIYIYDRSGEEDVLFKNPLSAFPYPEMSKTDYNKGTVIRAIAIDEKGYSGKELIESYFIDYKDKQSYNELPTISLVTDPDNLFEYHNGIYTTGEVFDNIGADGKENVFAYTANYTMSGKGWQRDGNVEYFDVDGNKLSSDQIKISIHGGYSRTNRQKGFNLIPITTSNSELFTSFGIKSDSLILKSAGNTATTQDLPNKIRDIVLQKIIKPLNLRTQDSFMVQVFIDGEYWGVYTIQERIDLGFIANYYDLNPDNIQILKVNIDENKIISSNENDINEFQEVIDFACNNDLSIDENYERICEMIDIDSFIDYYATELYMNNGDWVINNYCAWKTKDAEEGNPYGDTKWRFAVYDIVLSSGLIKNVGYDVDPFGLTSGGFYILTHQEYIFKALVKNEAFREKFLERTRYLTENLFDYETMKELTENEIVKYRLSLIESEKRFYDEEYDDAKFDKEINDFLEYFEERPNYFEKYLLDYYEYVKKTYN